MGRYLRSFLEDRSGSAALYTGVVILVLFMVTGFATDIGRSISVRTQLQRAATAPPSRVRPPTRAPPRHRPRRRRRRTT